MTIELSAAQKATLWRSGNIFYLLHAGQLDVYRRFRSWESTGLEMRLRGEEQPGDYPRVYILDCSRRFGKDFLSLIIAIENAIRRPGSVLTYATAFQKDINEIVVPLMEQILRDCPDKAKPVYRTSHQGTSNGYYFPNKSVLKMVGVETRPDSLRGRFSDGFFFSETSFISKLEEALISVCMPQLIGRLHAAFLLNSTPPVEPDHFWDTHLCPDAMARGAYVLRTIDDNPLLSRSEKEEFVRSAGGPTSERALREYYCVRIRSATQTVVPEFHRDTHVRESSYPPYAHGVTVIDPGVRDLCAVSTGYYDFERAKLVIRHAWSQRNANTNQVVAAIRELEEKTFANLPYWTNNGFKTNPLCRFSDTEARLVLDLNTIHEMRVVNVDKSSGREAMLHSFRNAVQLGRIEWHPEAELSISSVEAAVWNKDRSDWARTEKHGHFDQLAVAQYAWTMANKIDNPFPPSGVVMSRQYSRDDLALPHHTLVRNRRVADAWDRIWGKRKFRTRGRA